MALFLSILSTLVSIVASYLWVERYVSGRTSERIGETLANELTGGDDGGTSLVSILLPVSLRRVWNAIIITCCVAMFGLFHLGIILCFGDFLGSVAIYYAIYAFTLALWAVFLAFPARAFGEVLLRYRATKAR